MAERSRVRGSLFGLALGDALGAKTEFMSVERILKRWPLAGPQAPEGDPAFVTDDTQMALAVGEALAACLQAGSLTVEALTEALIRAFVDWYKSPDNCRAPGMTCMGACQALDMGIPWLRATVAGSKGCGANMRVAPVAFGPPELRAGLSQLQAVLTHGHPTGLAAADLTSLAVAELAAGCAPGSLPERLIAYCDAEATNYRDAWLGDHWKRPAVSDRVRFIGRGWAECRAALVRLEEGLKELDPGQDPCEVTGDGWIAEEALATGLYCFLLHPDDPVQVIRRAAITRGDSDSIACLAGAFAGAHAGDVWPEEWVARIEYRDRLEALTAALTA